MNKNLPKLDTNFMSYLIFLFFLIIFIIIISFPFSLKIDIRFNILRLKGVVIISIFNKFKIEFRIRIKHGYIYINHKNKLRKEKITKSNFNIIFAMKFIGQLYFREQFIDIIMRSNFGYVNDSRITAVGCGYMDVIYKSVLSKIKNNKKTTHIFVTVEPKYNQDVLNVRLINSIRISFLDILYAVIYTLIYSWGDYEKNRKSAIKK